MLKYNVINYSILNNYFYVTVFYKFEKTKFQNSRPANKENSKQVQLNFTFVIRKAAQDH